MYTKIEKLLEQSARQRDLETKKNSSTSNASRVCATDTDAEAEEMFSRLREKLLHIKLWNECSNLSSFMLYDKLGDLQQDKFAAVGDFIKITLHGSGKDDWVKIIEIYEARDEIVLTVQPSPDPTDTGDKAAATSHFFTGDSTNNFCLLRKNAKLSFFVIGLNEETNTEETGGVMETIRNTATANVGRYLGIQTFQWQTFCDNFFETGKEN